MTQRTGYFSALPHHPRRLCGESILRHQVLDCAMAAKQPVPPVVTKLVSFARGLKQFEGKKEDTMKANHLDCSEKKEVDVSNRRNFLKVAGAGLVAASVPSVAAGALKGAQSKEEDPTNRRPRPVYLYGCGWNRALPGVFGEVLSGI